MPPKPPKLPKIGQLEDSYTEPYQAWRNRPDPQTAGALLKAVTPDIDRGIVAHVGQDNPLLRSRARQLTLKAFQTYDPGKARLGTHIVNQLQGLKRISRQQSQVLSVPERIYLDQTHLHRQETELTDRLGREPTTQELADYSGISSRRIAKVRAYKQPLAEGSLMPLHPEEDVADYLPAIRSDNQSIMEIVYGDLDPINQTILEHSLGLHGRRVLSNKELAAQLRMTPGAVTQRKANIQRMLNQVSDLNPGGGILS